MLRDEWNDWFEIEDVYDTTSTSSEVYKAADDALVACINQMGYVNLPWMAEASGLSVKKLIGELEGSVIFQDPEQYHMHQMEEEDWILSPQYLSGNIREKLDEAILRNGQYNNRFAKNIQALKRVLPARVKIQDIGISIGSPWIPETFYSLFIKEALNLYGSPKVLHSPVCHQWKIVIPACVKDDINNIFIFGTKRMPALRILEHTLNATTVKIYDDVPCPGLKSGVARVLNKTETLAAQEKQENMQHLFQEWVVKDPRRVKYLEDVYYNTYACVVSGRFNGSFLTLPGLNPNFTPHPHQRNAIARVVLDKDVLLYHVVGSGKTNIQIIGIHERKRMGLSEKNLVVVPNNVLEAFESAHRELYPEDSILVIHPEDFTPDNRQNMLEKIRDEDHVAVYMAFSSFEMIHMSQVYYQKQLAKEIQSLRAKQMTTTDSWEKNKIIRLVAKKNEELEKMKKEQVPEEFLPFDHLGITTLVVDEAHNFKNITLDTNTDGVVGMHATGSDRCNELLEKSRLVREEGGGIIFSTGTPLTNSISDLFVLQTFLQPEQLDLLGLSHFDEWINSFATRKTGFEIDVDSQNYRIRTRFSSFHNLPELTSLFANVCDFYNGENSGMGLPKCEGYIDTVVPKSPEQQEYIENLVHRTEMIRAKCVRRDKDNLLRVTHDGRAAALDLRLVDSKLSPDPLGTKAYACAKNAVSCLKDHPGTAQLIFCDLGTPKAQFNLYDELKMHLVDLGVPSKQIAYIHSAKTDTQRRKLFEKVNKGEISVLIGSTQKLGMGVNVQENLIAVHHLDVPWKPSDITQREGRLIRQGNKNPQVYRYRYITAGTFDAYSWQIVENKQRFIGQFMSNTLVDRQCRELDDAVLTYAEIKALCVGDPLLKTRIEVANELEKAKIQHRQRKQELERLQHIVDASPKVMARLGEKKHSITSDWKYFLQCREKMTKHQRTVFGEQLMEALEKNQDTLQDRFLTCVHGFRIFLPKEMNPEKPYIFMVGTSCMRYPVDMADAKSMGCIQRIEYQLLHLKEQIQEMDEEIKKQKERVRQAKEEIQRGDAFARSIAQLTEQLLDIDEELNRRAQAPAA